MRRRRSARWTGCSRTHEGPLDSEAFADFRASLAADRAVPPDLAPVAEALRHTRERVDLWTLHETGWDAIAGGLKRTYRRARKGRKGRTDAELHAWRKRIKYHWYHVRLLREIWPDGMDARETAADAMGEQLGLHQDLVMLDRRVRESDLSKEARRVLRGLIGRRKEEAETKAREIAPQLLSDKPKALSSRWGEQWEAWRS